MAAAVLIVTMLAGCKQGESAVQAAENGATVQTGQNEAVVQDAGNEAAALAAESAEYAVRDVKIFDGEPTDRTIPLRFYKEAPHAHNSAAVLQRGAACRVYGDQGVF